MDEDNIPHVTLGQTRRLRELLDSEHIDWWFNPPESNRPDYTAWLNECGECFESKDGPDNLVSLKVSFVCTPEEAVALSKLFLRELVEAEE